MQVNINKEIRHYQENVCMGLSLRQALCAGCAVGVAVGVYLLAQPALGQETASWLCILGAAPVAAAGFFRYNGLTLEQFAWAVLHSEFLCAGPRVWRVENRLYQLHQRSQRRNRAGKPKERTKGETPHEFA